MVLRQVRGTMGKECDWLCSFRGSCWWRGGAKGVRLAQERHKGRRAIIQPVPATPVGIARLQEAEGRWRLRGSVSLGVKVET